MSFETEESIFREITLTWINGNLKDAVEDYRVLPEKGRVGFAIYFISDDCQTDEQVAALQLLSRYHRSM